MTSAALYENMYKDNFSFGKNWQDFLKKLDDKKLEDAKAYLIQFIGWIDTIQWSSVIDFGSGSGLMSLAYCLCGAARVLSVDIDDASIECAQYLRQKYAIPEEIWQIQKWSILDARYIESLWKFDIVYSWGVIHHSGDMWRGLENLNMLCTKDSLLYVALYNDNQVLLEWKSSLWVHIKKLYSSTRWIRPILKAFYTMYLIIGLTVHGINPLRYIRQYHINSLRGMDFFVDVEDWLWGYPYEYASYQRIVDFYTHKGFKALNGVKVRSIGCNEFLFISQ